MSDPELRARCRASRSSRARIPCPTTRSLAAGAELERARCSICARDVFPVFLVSGRQLEPGRGAARGRFARGRCARSTNAGSPRAGTSRQLNVGAHATLAPQGRAASRGCSRGRRRARVVHLRRARRRSGRDRLRVVRARAGGADGIERAGVANVEIAVRAVVEAGACARLDARNRSRAIRRRCGRGGQAISSRALRARERDGLVWGGESTVTLPAQHGRGGRNTHLALTLARQLRAGEPWHAARRGHGWHRWSDRRCRRHRRCGNASSARRSRAATSNARGANSIPAPRSKLPKISCTRDRRARTSGIS